MNRKGILFPAIAAVATAALGVTAASAADVAPVIPVAPPVVVVTAPPPGFDFAGAYVGVMGGAYFDVGPIAFDNPRAGILAGYNFTTGRLVFGAEAGLTWEGGAAFDATIVGRAGFLIGQRALVYAAAGYLQGLTYSDGWFTLGGGVEVGLGQRLSIFAEAHYLFPTGFTAQTGIKFHFGN